MNPTGFPERMALPCLLPFLAVALSLIPTISAQSYSNITRGTTLTAGGYPDTWRSPSGDFAFGFYATGSDNASLFLLAIWFDSTIPKSVIWFANGNKPVAAGSTLQLTSDGRLTLRDQRGTAVWSTSVNSATIAAILDTGNLVLVGDDPSGYLWQSFSDTKDTILPGQALKVGSNDSRLRSKLTATDFSDGRFLLVAQADGNFELRPLALGSGNQYESYWSIAAGDSGTKLVYNLSGSLYFAFSNGSLQNVTSAATYSTQTYYQRATLDPDGVFRQYIYPKKGGKAWIAVGGVPSDIRRALNSDDAGNNDCGFNGYWVSSTDLAMPTCECPPQYSFIDPQLKDKGCTQNFLTDCRRYDSSMFELISMTNVDWPFMDYEHYTGVGIDKCKQYCLEDCFCAVAIYWDQNECWKKKLPLSNGKMSTSVDRIALIKVPKDNYTLAVPPPPTVMVEKKTTWNHVSAGLLGSSGVLNLINIALIFAMVVGSRRKRTQKDVQQTEVPEFSLRAFTFKELEEATNGFKEELGKGAFGSVYRGVLPSVATDIAVKKLDRLINETEKEFMNEVRSIGQTHHKNLVKLFGYCNEGTHRLLVYEYMSNGSLMGFLFGEMKPRWVKRTQMILDIARGLLYLHEECSAPIIHCDIKPQNVLLDDNLVAKISDFGLAKLMMTDQTRTFTGIKGTRGYVAPEWFKSTAITKKVDVYSFGVMMLEIICCKRNLDTDIVLGEESEEPVLVYRAYDYYREGMLEVLVQMDEEALADIALLERFVKVALWCIQEDPSNRPSMQKVTQMLEGAVDVPVPPEPFSFFSAVD